MPTRSPALTILERASEIVEGSSCDCSTECCRFGLTGREPWLTRAEFELVEAWIKAQGRRLPKPPDATDGRCALLTAEGRCSVYPARPLGCRTYFCAKARHADGRRGKLGSATTRALRDLPRELADLDPGVESKPLHAWLSPPDRTKRRR